MPTDDKTLEQQEKDLAIGLINAEKLMFSPNAQIEVKDIIDKFAVITYDIPATKEGNKMRAELSYRLKFSGAVQHTESVYLAPWSRVIDIGVLLAAEVGEVYVWVSTPQTDELARKVTLAYDKKILEVFKETEERLGKIGKHIEDGKFGLAHKMLPKAEEQVNNLVKVAVARGSQMLYDRWSTMKQILDACSALVAYKTDGDVTKMVDAIANNPDVKASFEAATAAATA